MPQYPQEVTRELEPKVMAYPYLPSTYTGILIEWVFAIKPPPPQRTHTLWPFKDPWALNGGPWPFWHRDDPDPAHFPLSDTIISTLNEGQASKLTSFCPLHATEWTERVGFVFLLHQTGTLLTAIRCNSMRHSLNPIICERVPWRKIFDGYVNCLRTQIELHGHAWVQPTTQKLFLWSSANRQRKLLRQVYNQSGERSHAMRPVWKEIMHTCLWTQSFRRSIIFSWK